MTHIETLVCIAGALLVIGVPLWLTERSLGRLPSPGAAPEFKAGLRITFGPETWTPFSHGDEL